ncbi:MAG: DUF4856 domain-containing protein [Gammaproteobacteria bacterium]|nr:DUF4856 domain-containing protein [Gammaproteobacteria bacterium]MCY4219790.1 DUF4856 domain-containing protein [Gammaproteobacteria bacterium]
MKANCIQTNHCFVLAVVLSFGISSLASAQTYGPNPITLKGYSGGKTDSTAYTGQAARQVLHTSLKKLASQGNGSNAKELKELMMQYFSGKEEGRTIIAPGSRDGFTIAQSTIDQISKGVNLKGKTYKGVVNGWPGKMTGSEVIEFMINKAANTKGGFDPVTGFDYPQLISKFAMGAVFYHQAVDNYLDEKLEADNKPNDRPYGEGKHYTGKEHSWDEGFGYFGAPVHTLNLDANQAYGIAKMKDQAVADYNKDGKVDLYREMTYAHAYYAADSDKAGTDYLHSIFKAFLDGRKLIAGANGEALNPDQRAQLKAYAETIKTLWEKVIAEAVFKYAGSVYKDLEKLQTIVETGGNAGDTFRAYAKHWGELKGFAMALETGGKDLGEVGTRINRLIGYGPVLLGGGQVTGIDADGNYQIGGTRDIGGYMVHMLKLQKLMDDTYNLEAKKNDATGDLEGLVNALSEGSYSEND